MLFFYIWMSAFISIFISQCGVRCCSFSCQCLMIIERTIRHIRLLYYISVWIESWYWSNTFLHPCCGGREPNQRWWPAGNIDGSERWPGRLSRLPVCVNVKRKWDFREWMVTGIVCIAARCEQECDVSECGGGQIPPASSSALFLCCLLSPFSPFSLCHKSVMPFISPPSPGSLVFWTLTVGIHTESPVCVKCALDPGMWLNELNGLKIPVSFILANKDTLNAFFHWNVSIFFALETSKV